MSNHPLLTVEDLQNLIEHQRIDAHLIHNIGHTPTVPAAAEALGVTPDQIVKTLLFLVHQSNEDPAAEVVISNGERRVEKKALARHFDVGTKRVRLASPQVVLETLGYPAGGVPPFGHRTRLPVIVDSMVVALHDHSPDSSGETGQIFAGGGDDRTMMALSVDELLRVVQPTILAVS